MGRRRGVERKPHFFKVLLGDFAQRLKMPPNFLKHISKETSNAATLEGPNGSCWRVKIKRSCNGTFLSTGWPQFVKDHSLKEREFLVFRYNGNLNFSIQVFDTTACEREDLFAVQSYRKQNLAKGAKKRIKSRKQLDVASHIEQQETNAGCLKLLTNGNIEAEHLHDVIINSVDEMCVTSLNPLVDDNKATTGTEYLPINFSKRRPVTAEERYRAGEVAKSFHSHLPYVLMRMSVTTVYKRYLMRFPLYFSRKHLPRQRTNVSLKDPSGKSWTVTYVPGERQQRDRLSIGWAAFAHSNNIEEGDYCAFELTDPIELTVHIFRVVEETPLAIEAPAN